jgi:DNA-binding NarL/FixJ family response regulator
VTRHALIVDDHPGFREQARRLLEEIGVQVVSEAATGQEALSAVRCLKPDLVLLDIQLPDLDGFAVAAELTSVSPSPIIVLVSTRDATNYGSRVETSGAAAFIAKVDLSTDCLLSLLV